MREHFRLKPYIVRHFIIDVVSLFTSYFFRNTLIAFGKCMLNSNRNRKLQFLQVNKLYHFILWGKLRNDICSKLSKNILVHNLFETKLVISKLERMFVRRTMHFFNYGRHCSSHVVIPIFSHREYRLAAKKTFFVKLAIYQKKTRVYIFKKHN